MSREVRRGQSCLSKVLLLFFLFNRENYYDHQLWPLELKHRGRFVAPDYFCNEIKEELHVGTWDFTVYKAGETRVQPEIQPPPKKQSLALIQYQCNL